MGVKAGSFRLVGGRVLALALTFVLTLSLVPGGTLEVGAADQIGDFATLKSKIESASPGATLEIEITGNITFTDSITIDDGKAVWLESSNSSLRALNMSAGDTRHFVVRDGGELYGKLLKLDGGAVGGGVKVSGGGKLDLYWDSEVVNCYTSGNGGGVEVDESSQFAAYSDVVISGNRAGNGGGGVFSQGSVSLSDTTISDNTAPYGGGVYNAGSVAANDVTVAGNQQGGGIYNDGTTSKFEWTGGTLASNTNTGSTGGGVSNIGGCLQFQRVNITGNQTSGNGGGVYMVDSNDRDYLYLTNLDHCEISGNQAAGNGGGVYVESSYFRTVSTSFKNNRATYGGAAFFEGFEQDENIPAFETATFDRNSATYGGGIALGNSTVSGGPITGNSATYGGGVYLLDGGHYRVADAGDSTLSGNTADYGGGAYLNGADALLEVDGAVISGNTAKYDGGGVYVKQGQVGEAPLAQNGFFTGNTAQQGKGGAIYTEEYESVYIGYGSGFSGNTAASFVADIDDASKVIHGQYIYEGATFSGGARYAYNNYDINYIEKGTEQIPAPRIDSITPEKNPLEWDEGEVVLTIRGANLDLYESIEIKADYDDEARPVFVPSSGTSEVSYLWVQIPENNSETPVVYIFTAMGNRTEGDRRPDTASTWVGVKGTSGEEPEEPKGPDIITEEEGGDRGYRGGGHGSGFRGNAPVQNGPAPFDILEHQTQMAIDEYIDAMNELQLQRAAGEPGTVPPAPVVALENAGYLSQEQLQRAASGVREALGNSSGVDVTLHLDSTSGNILQGRIYLNPAEAHTDIWSGVYTSGEEVDKLRRALRRQLGSDRVQVVSLQQRESFGTSVQIAVNVDLSELSASSLHLYTWDPETGVLERITGKTFVDTAGFLNFSTDMGGDIVIADTALV